MSHKVAHSITKAHTLDRAHFWADYTLSELVVSP